MNEVTEVGQKQETSPIEEIMQKLRELRNEAKTNLILGGFSAGSALMMKGLAEHVIKEGGPLGLSIFAFIASGGIGIGALLLGREALEKTQEASILSANLFLAQTLRKDPNLAEKL